MNLPTRVAAKIKVRKFLILTFFSAQNAYLLVHIFSKMFPPDLEFLWHTGVERTKLRQVTVTFTLVNSSR